MLTPQDLEKVSFGRATFGGYDMESVDTFLGTLIDDFNTLYKENALLKSKMKVLVGKLEEYRDNEASLKEAIMNAQKTCDLMVKEAEEKCSQMLLDANAEAIENAKNADNKIAAEEARVEEARRAASAKIDALKDQFMACVQELDRIKAENPPAPVVEREQVESRPVDKADAMAAEIAATLETMIGPVEELVPTAEPKHPFSDTSSKFKDLANKFGSGYDPTR